MDLKQFDPTLKDEEKQDGIFLYDFFLNILFWLIIAALTVFLIYEIPTHAAKH